MLFKREHLLPQAVTQFLIWSISLLVQVTPFFVDIDKHNLGPDINELIGLIESEKLGSNLYTFTWI